MNMYMYMKMLVMYMYMYRNILNILSQRYYRCYRHLLTHTHPPLGYIC